MPWNPLPAVAFAICVYPFRAAHTDDLPLQIGDNIYIIEQGGTSNEWYRGYLVAPPSLLAGLNTDRGQQLEHRVFTGIFPRNCVEVRELLGESKGNEQGDPAYGEEGSEIGEGELSEKRKSQAVQARRLSRALTRRKSTHDGQKKGGKPLVDYSEPMPRLPNAPKPLAPVPLLRVGDEAGQSVDEPLVDEIASCLREWHDARLHELLLSRGYSQLGRVQELIKRVDTSRKQLMHDVLTNKELAQMREDTVWDLVAGNKMLNDDVIVRSPTEKGRILTADDSVVEMTKLQANMSILDRPPQVSTDMQMHYHVLIEVRSAVCDFDPPATLHVQLYTMELASKPKLLSENFAVTVPLPAGNALTAEDQTKTMFVGLSAMDVGLGTDKTRIFAVFKLLKEEAVRQEATILPASGNQTQSFGEPISNPSRLSTLKSRRSTLKKAKSTHTRGPSEATIRPATGLSQASESPSHTSGSTLDAPTAQTVKTVKRLIGVGALELGHLAQSQSSMEKPITLWTPAASPAADRSDEGDDWEEIIRELQRSANGGYSRVDSMKRCDVFASIFGSADFESLLRNNPSLLHDAHLSQKLGFSGAPTQKRSDIYLTLTEPLVARNSFLQHSKYGNVLLEQRCQTSMANLQLTLEVRNAQGERIEDCIYTASNHAGHTAWRTNGIERDEAWNQTIKLAIPPEDVPGSHVVMSIADSPNFPFALAWVPLWENEAFVRDGEHQVALYVYDEYSSSVVGGKGAYLMLPPWHDKKHKNAQTTLATISMHTYLCSTEYSQDPDLLGLLNWRSLHGAKLMELLARFSFVPEIEVVKLLPDVFEALFQILDEYAKSESYEDLIFYNFVVIMGIARDRRFNLTSVIEENARSRCDWPLASECLIRAYQRLLSSPLDPDSSRKLRATLKVGDQMLRLIVETSRQRVNDDNAPTNGNAVPRHPDFEQDLQTLFVAIMALMRNPMPVLLGTQTLVVQKFHSWLPELTSVMSAGEILEVATNLLDACSHAQGRMILYRLILVINYSQLDLFKQPDVRTTLIANTLRWLEPYWGKSAVITDQWRDQVRLCCSVVAAQMEELGEDSCQYVPKLVASYTTLQKAPRTPRNTFSMLFPTTYPFPTKPTASEIDVDEAMLEISALLAAALTTQQRLYFDANQVDVSGVLLQVLKVGRSILHGDAFPRSWLSLHVSHHRYAISALERISDFLIDELPDVYAPDVEEVIDFDTETWRTFFETLFAAVSSPVLAMEMFPEQKRRAVWKIAGDVRETGAHLIRRCWNAIGWETQPESRKLHGFDRMGGFQVQFVPDLIPPVVELCLSVHAGLRNVAVEVLRTMIISTWEIDQELSTIQSAMIDCLDKLCRTKQVTESMLQKTFIDEMVAQFSPLQNTVEDSLYNAVVEMFGRIEELLGMLASIHQGGTMNEAVKIVDTLRLMEFLRDVRSEEAYVRYVHQLADLQSASGNHTEAGLALRMHADRYDWDPSFNLEEIAEPALPVQTAFERKEALFFEMCAHFEKGRSWQRALAAYKELAHQYEINIFDFSKLARAQRAMAAIHEKIARGERVNPRYFRVVYKGMGFPVSLRDKEFIYEGQPTDRQATFEDRLQQSHPGSRVLHNRSESDVEGRYLHVSPVSLEKDLMHTVYQRTKVSQAAREYALMSNPWKFTTTSRQPQPDVPVSEQVVQKTIYTTSEPFPTLLRRSEIVKTEDLTLTPIQAAVERTTRKTMDMLSLEKRVASDDDDGARKRLTELLLLAVDPHADSGVWRYRSLLPASEQDDNGSDEIAFSVLDEAEQRPPLTRLENALNVALLDHALAIRRCLTLYNSSAHLATKAELVPRFEATYARELNTLFPNQQGLVEASSSQRSSLQSRDPAIRVSRAEDSQQAAAGAELSSEQADGGAGAGPEPEKRNSRRRSLPFLRRVGSNSSKTNVASPGDGDDGGRGGRGHTRSRSRSRVRENSLTRRLSGFRREQDSKLSGDRGGGGMMARSRQGSLANLRDADRPATGTSMGAGSLKKRLSFLKSGEQY